MNTEVTMLLGLSLAFAQPLYVHASTLALRREPAAEARLEGWIRVNTAVEVLEERGSWLRVRVGGRPEAHAVEGWVAGEFLGTYRLAASTARQAGLDAEARGDLAGAQAWFERENALAPQDLVSWMDLDRVARALGTAPARTLEGPSELAVCDGTRVEYLGRLDAQGTLDDRHFWDGERSSLLALSAQHWVQVRPGAVAALEGSPFVRPFATEAWNESGGSPWAPGTCDGICEERKKIVLGPCEDAGAVYLTRPATLIEAAPADPVVQERLAALARGLGVSDPGGARRRGRWTELNVTAGLEGWSLLTDGSMTLVLPTRRAYEFAETPARPATSLWIELPGYVPLIVTPVEHGNIGGWLVVGLGSPSRVQASAVEVLTWGYGC